MNVDHQVGKIKSWKQMPSSIFEIFKNLISGIRSNYKFLGKFGAGISYFSTSIFFHVVSTFLQGFGIALLIPIAQGLIQHDFQALVTNKSFAFLFEKIPILTSLNDNGLLFVLIGSILLALAAKSIFEYYTGNYQLKKEQSVVNKVSKYIFDQYMNFGLKFYDQTTASRNHLNLIRAPRIFMAALKSINATFLQSIECLMLLGLIAILSWKFALLALCVIPIYVVVMKLFNERVKNLVQEDDIAELEESSNEIEYFSRIPLMKALGAEDTERKNYHSAIAAKSSRKLKMQKVLSVRSPLQEIITIIFVFLFVFALAYSSAHVNNPDILAVYLVIFITFQQLIKKAKNLTSQALRISTTMNQLTLTIEEMQKDDDYNVASGSLQLDSKIDNIEFKDLSFAYEKGKQVLNAFSLKIVDKEHLVILGKNGSGKSTLMSLVLRFYECPKASIYINGRDIQEYNIRSIRKQIAYISQDACVFKDSLKNNITYGLDYELNPEQWKDLIARADLENLIEKLPQGLDSIIGDKGVTLSGGEKQRISIARAFLRDAPIVIMDEPTNALDLIAEQKFSSDVVHSFKNKIVIIITHKPKIAKHFDKIAIIEEGKLSNYGTYKDLVGKSAFLPNK